MEPSLGNTTVLPPPQAQGFHWGLHSLTVSEILQTCCLVFRFFTPYKCLRRRRRRRKRMTKRKREGEREEKKERREREKREGKENFGRGGNIAACR